MPVLSGGDLENSLRQLGTKEAQFGRQLCLNISVRVWWVKESWFRCHHHCLGQITIDLRSSVVVAIMNIIDLTPQQPRRAHRSKKNSILWTENSSAYSMAQWMMELLSRTSALERGDEKENCGGAAGTLGEA
jgi:hypothetical protein